ncbi:MAG: preprotein translocase subunit YajC, partial [Gemmatimonadota bacterium]|nr:preprotein translocase subunit YajC [Gemmatimonadota bacterium]
MFDLISTAYALGGGPSDGGQQPNPIASLLPFALMFLVLYLLILRPQMKKQRNQQRMIDELE